MTVRIGSGTAELSPTLDGGSTIHSGPPVALIAETPLILVASPSLGIDNVSGLLALARQKPGQLGYASFGAGSPSHLAGEALKAATQVDLLHVPYRGGAAALLAVIGGQVASGFVTPLTAMVKAAGLKVDE